MKNLKTLSIEDIENIYPNTKTEYALTTNRTVFIKYRKGLYAGCARCSWHKGCNYRGYYSGYFNINAAADIDTIFDTDGYNLKEAIGTNYPSWKLTSRCNKQYEKKKLKLHFYTIRWNMYPYYGNGCQHFSFKI